MSLAPVALFAYNRADHLARTIAALQQNHGAESTDVIVFCDAPRNSAAEQGAREVRRYVETIQGFRSVRICHRPRNLGLARSIIDGVTSTLASSDQIIVLEDDMITSPYFLRYMNDGLQRFSDNDRIASIHGYSAPTREPLPEAFFLRGADCWGWGTWARAWKTFNADGQVLLDQLREKRLLREFDFDSSYPYSTMLEDQIAGRNDSWAIRWYASTFLADMLTLHPGRSLIQNIGNDGSGTHSGATSRFDVDLATTALDLSGVQVKVSSAAFNAYRKFHRRVQGGLTIRALRRLRSLLTNPR